MRASKNEAAPKERKREELRLTHHVANLNCFIIDILFASELKLRICLKGLIGLFGISIIRQRRLARSNFQLAETTELSIAHSLIGLKNEEIDPNRAILLSSQAMDYLLLRQFQWVKVQVRTNKSKDPIDLKKSNVGFICQVIFDEKSSEEYAMKLTPTTKCNLQRQLTPQITVGRKFLNQVEFSIEMISLSKIDNLFVQFKSLNAKSVKLSIMKQYGAELNIDILDDSIKEYFTTKRHLQIEDIITLRVQKNQLHFAKAIEIDNQEAKENNTMLYTVSKELSSVSINPSEINGFFPKVSLRDLEEGKTMPLSPPHLAKNIEEIMPIFNLVENCHNSPNEKKFRHFVSILLHGPIGNGKYHLAKGFATNCGINFHPVNSINLVGDTSAFGEARLKGLIEKAKAFAPILIYIKNIHLLGRDKEGNEDKRMILSYSDFIREMTIWNSTPPNFPILIICSTDKPDNIPKGILSSFNKRLNIGFKEDTSILIMQWLLTKYKIKFNGDLNSWMQNLKNRPEFCRFKDLKTLLTIAFRKSIAEDQRVKESGTVLDQAQLNFALQEMELIYKDSLGSPKVPKVYWKDIGGLADVKKELVNSFQLPLQFPHLFSSGLKRSGILLYGPPGTGKTLIAKAVATEFKLNFLSVKGPELLNMYVGQSEQNVREVFEKARSAAPCIIFFDELDSLAPNRGKSGDSGGVMDRVVSQILAEMDGSHSSPNVFIIAATNRPDLIDPALLRPGRFDKLLYVGICDDIESKIKIMKALTRKFNLSKEVNFKDISLKLPIHMTGADIYSFCAAAYINAVSKKIEYLEGNETSNESEHSIEVTHRDFENALQNVTVSLNKEIIKKYQQMSTLKR